MLKVLQNNWSDLEHHRYCFFSFGAYFHLYEPILVRSKFESIHYWRFSSVLPVAEVVLFHEDVLTDCSLHKNDSWYVHRYQNLLIDILCRSACYFQLPLHHWNVHQSIAIRFWQRARSNWWWDLYSCLYLRLHVSSGWAWCR